MGQAGSHSCNSVLPHWVPGSDSLSLPLHVSDKCPGLFIEKAVLPAPKHTPFLAKRTVGVGSDWTQMLHPSDLCHPDVTTPLFLPLLPHIDPGSGALSAYVVSPILGPKHFQMGFSLTLSISVAKPSGVSGIFGCLDIF